MLRGAEDVEPLAIVHREIVGATEIVLQPVVRRQADGADMIGVDRPENIVLVDVAESGGRSERSGWISAIAAGTMLPRNSNHSVLMLSLKRRRKSPGRTSL